MMASLDLGSSEFRSLRREEQRLIARRMPAVYTVLEDVPGNRRLLEQSQIPFSTPAGSLVVIGEPAQEVSRLLRHPLVPLLTGGVLGEQDPVSRQVCAWLINLLLPRAQSPHDLCVMTIPCGEATGTLQDSWTPQFLEHVVQLQGYQTCVMQPAHALAIAELEDHEFTGICLSVGAESISFCATLHSQPVLEARPHKGTREILERFAHEHQKFIWDSNGNSFLNLAAVSRWLTDSEISLVAPQTEEEAWLASALEELLLSTCFQLKRKVAACTDSILRQPLPLLISGGITRLHGFRDLVAESIKLSGLPVQISEIQPATFEPYSVSRGLLIQATLASGDYPPLRHPLEAA